MPLPRSEGPVPASQDRRDRGSDRRLRPLRASGIPRGGGADRDGGRPRGLGPGGARVRATCYSYPILMSYVFLTKIGDKWLMADLRKAVARHFFRARIGMPPTP